MRTLAYLAVLVCATLSVPAQDAADEGTASNLRALEHDWVEGQSSHDNASLDLIFDNALVYIEYGKVMTKGEYLSRVKKVSSHPELIVMEAMTVRTFGGTAIVVGTYREKGRKDGKPFLQRWRFIDTWVKTEGNWRLVAAASSPMSK